MKGRVLWPKKFQEKEVFPLTRNVINSRINIEHERVLYAEENSLRSLCRRSGVFYLLIGDGLFSNIDYEIDDHIADYNGDLISLEEVERRDAAD